MPELTKPTTITVVADDDWMAAVTPAPKRTANIGFEVSFSSIVSSFPPDSFSSPSPSECIPYRNNAKPPSIDKTSNKSIILTHAFLISYVFLPHIF